MAVYRFRVAFEDNEEITRDIEIKSGQTFKDFHQAILESIKFDTKHAASFFVSDDYWRKNQEVTLLEEDQEDGAKLMKDTKISSCIETPYQRFIYIYDKKVQWTFLIELIKIDAEKPKVNYPVCIKTQGHAPKQYKQDILATEKSNKEKDPLAALLGGNVDDEDDELEEEAYKNAPDTEMGLNDGDLDFAQSEEGEEEEKGSEEDGDEHHDEEEGGDNYGFDEDGHDDERY